MTVSETTSSKQVDRTALLPERHPNHDLFICDVLDAIPKDDMASMEHPIFSLATKPDTRTLRYEHRNVKIEITPSARGLATIFDKDILIYCISQMIAKKNQGKPLARTIELNARELLVWSNRETSGNGYRRLKEAFQRLQGTQITTNIRTNGQLEDEIFSLIERVRIVKEEGSDRMQQLQVTLSKWMFNLVEGAEVLTLSRDYFRLRKPIDRRIYEIARKHCGEQDEWRVGIDLLHKKVGASSHTRAFRAMVKELVESDHLPEYSVGLDGDVVIFSNRTALEARVPEETFPRLDPETYHDARTVAPGYDVYGLEQEWREFWVATGMPQLHSPDKAFIAFCKSRAKRQPLG